MMKKLNLLAVLVLTFISTTNVFSQSEGTIENPKKIYVKPYAGFIGIQDMRLQLKDENHSAELTIENGFGLTTGISVGYNFTQNFSAELGWEYKTNNIKVTNNNLTSDGDYASNFIYLSTNYLFNTQSRFQPYAGLGLSYIQEVDLDFGAGEETSFSNFGNLGIQAQAGLDFNLSERWAINWEAKYLRFKDFDMENEANSSELTGLKYNPFIFNVGVKCRF